MARKRDEEWQQLKGEIISAYESGQSVESLKEHYKIGTSTLYNIIRSAGNVPDRMYSRKTGDIKETVRDLYLKGISTRSIARDFNIGVATVYLIL